MLSLVAQMRARLGNCDIIKQACVLNPGIWPTNDAERMLFGDQEVLSLASFVSLVSKTHAP